METQGAWEEANAHQREKDKNEPLSTAIQTTHRHHLMEKRTQRTSNGFHPTQEHASIPVEAQGVIASSVMRVTSAGRTYSDD